MTVFKIHGEKWDTGEKKVFLYDNATSKVTIAGSNTDIDLSQFDIYYTGGRESKASPFNKVTPIGKVSSPEKLKIQLGLKCNYSCTYCSQAQHVEGSIDAAPWEVSSFMQRLAKLDLSHTKQIEFWGGEPLVYWKTLRPLAIELRERCPNATFLVITNGSVLSDEIIDFLDDMNFAVAVSHDGPGQYLRGPDPFDDPDKKAMLLKLIERLHPKRRLSFNSVMNAKNQSRKAVLDWFEKMTGYADIRFGEGAMIDAYDSAGMELSLYDYQDMIRYRRTALSELYNLDRDRVSIFKNKVTSFISSVVNGRSWSSLGQKCGMDRPENLAIDMNGNVLTCQNVSANKTSFNGVSHKIGNIDDMDAVKLNTGTHWSFKKGCSECPVLQLCGGSCFMLEGAEWERSCDNAYNDNVVFFMYAFEVLTGFLPYYIEHPNLPEWRKDVLGMDKPDLTRKRKVIPLAIA